jgi:electron transfer flavoprotein alpha subunit
MGSEIADLASSLFKYGADKVILIDHPILKEYVTEPYAKALTTLINEYDPEIMLFGATSIGRDLAPRVASRIHTGLTADCTGLKIDPDTKLLHMTRPAFGGNIMATIVCKEYRPQMATFRPGVMSVLKSENAVSGEVIKLNVGFIPEDMNVEILKIEKNTRKSVDITEAKVLVSGGRGVSGPNGFAPLRELADVLHGEVSASRVCVDNGWAEAGRQVGQTGKTVRPKLYIACGISGAIQHVAGMENSDFIIAINKDKDSPMMNLADLAVEGDISKILPLLTEEIKRRKSASPAG